MKIARWLLLLVLSCGDVATQLQLATDENYQLIPSRVGVPRTDNGATAADLQLQISCDQCTLQLDQDLEKDLVDTTFLCGSSSSDGDLQHRLIGAFTTAQEAQLILSSIDYHPNLNYQDPLCDVDEIVRMQLLPLSGDVPQPPMDACVAVNIDDNPILAVRGIRVQEISAATVDDAISIFLETLNTPALVASGAMHARVSRMRKKLGIRLPVSYLQVDLSRTVTINDIGFEGCADKVKFIVSCTKGTISLLGNQLPLGKFGNLDSTLTINGMFSTLEETFRHSYLIYTPRANAVGYDSLVFIVESAGDQALEILPIVINAPMEPPSLTLPATPISVFESDYISIGGVMLEKRKEHVSPSRDITVNITTQSGMVALVTDDTGHNPHRSTGIQIQGGIDNINAALKGLRYRSPVGGSVAGDLIHFTTFWTAKHGEDFFPVKSAIPIKIIKRPLTINILVDGKIIGDSSLLTTTMNTPVSLEKLMIQIDAGDGRRSECNGSAAASIGANGDACDDVIDISLFAGHGLVSNLIEPFSPGKLQGLPFLLAHFIGDVARANNFLQQQVYVPNAKFQGPDQLVINIIRTTSTTDNEGATFEDTVLLPVFVVPDCEPPQLTWVDSGTNMLNYSSVSRIPFALPEIGLSREGLEKGYCQDDIGFRVTIQTDQGFLTLKSDPGTVTPSSSYRVLVLEGRLWDLNLALNSVEYQFEIRCDTQIPLVASVDIRVQGETSQENDLPAVITSALLRLRFVGDTSLPDMLSSEAITGFEDTDMLIGDEIILDAIVALADDSVISISVQNGVIYAAADGIHMNARSEQQVTTKDRRQLQSVLTNLRYIPNPNFNGIDQVHFQMENQQSTLYIYVQAENDPPDLTFNSDEMKDWYKYPRMFIPSFQIIDPDNGQIFQVNIRVDNGSLFVDQMSSNAFDGVTVELNSTLASLQMMSTKLSRLNTIFLLRLVEVVPNVCADDGTKRVSCAMLIVLCVDDGSSSLCEELYSPEQDLFYHVVVSDWANDLNVSAGNLLNISGAFQIHQKFDVMHELFLRVNVSSGFIYMDIPGCGELCSVVSSDERQRSERFGITQTIYASDTACLNEALGSMQLQSTYGENDSIAVQLELVSEELRPLANNSIVVKVIDKLLPKRIIRVVVRTTDSDLWIARHDNYTKLTSLATISILVDPETDDEELDLIVSCLTCQWNYQTFVPRVSYEFARIPSSSLRFLGLRDSLSKVLESLELTSVSGSTSGTETVHFQLTPALPQFARGVEPVWSASTNISVPFTMQSEPPLEKSQQRARALYTNSPNAERNEIFSIGSFSDQGHGIESYVPKQTSMKIPSCQQAFLTKPSSLIGGHDGSLQVSSGTDPTGNGDGVIAQASGIIPSASVGGGIVLTAGSGLSSDLEDGDGDGSEVILSGRYANGIDPTINVGGSVGKMDRLNLVLQTLRDQCGVACKYQDAVIQAKTPLTPTSASDISKYQIVPVDQSYDTPVPRVTTGSSLYYSTEDAAFQFPDLALRFGDDDTDPPSQGNSYTYRLEIRVNYGVISIICTTSLIDDIQQMRKNEIELEGTAFKLELDLSRLVYFPPQNWNEEQFPGGHIVEWEFVVSSVNKSVKSFADLVITPRVDAPVISVPHALEDPTHYMGDYLSVLRLECLPLVCDEDTPIVLDGFSVRAADTTPNQLSPRDLLVARLTVTHGILSLGDTWYTNCISRFVGAQSSKRVSFEAEVDCMNRVLEAMVYVGGPNFSGDDQLKIRVEYARELDAAFDQVTIPIIVVELNDAPYIALDSVYYEAEENVALVIDNLQLRDPDALDKSLRVILEANYGKLALLRPNGINLTTETVNSAGNNASRLTLEGTLPNLDSTLASVVYTSAKDWNSLQFLPDGGESGMNGFDTITVYSTDFSSFNGSSMSALFVYVDPTPDPVSFDDPSGTLRGDEPMWNVSSSMVRGIQQGKAASVATFDSGGSQSSTTTVMPSPVVWSRSGFSILVPEDVLTLDEDTALVFGGDLQLIYPDSAHSFTSLFELTITCSNGTFALSSTVTGIQVLRNDSNGNIVIRGFFAQLNAALNGSSYIPAANWSGSESLSLSVTKLSHLEKSEETATASVFLFVAPVCDEPYWVVLTDDPLTMQEDGYLPVDTLMLTSPDLDDEEREIEVTIDVKHGGVMLSRTRGLLILQAGYSTSEDRLVAQNAAPGQTFSRSRLFFKGLIFSGRVSDINAALKGMVFKPWLDYNSDGWPVDEIELKVTSDCSSSGSTSALGVAHVVIPIAVDAVNDPPVLVSQHFQAVFPPFSLSDLEAASRDYLIEAVEDLPQQLETVELYDPDYDLRSGDLRLLVNISCIHCTITSEYLSHSSQTQPSDDLIVVKRMWRNEEGVQLVVHGNLPSLNNGLMNQLIFQGTDNFNGLAFVLMEIFDLGNYGEGGEKHSVFALAVKVRPVNDIPQIHLPQYQSQEPALQLDEGASVLIQGASAISSTAVLGRRQTLQWSVMVADLLANDPNTRLRRLQQFGGAVGLAASFLVSFNGGLLFSGQDADSGQEIWCSDGTAAGTALLKDIFPGSAGSRPSYLTPFSKDNRIYFAAEGPHLSWMVKNDYQDTCKSSRQSSIDPNVFFTVAAQNLWDPQETYDCPLGFRWMSTSEASRVFVGTVALDGHKEEPLTYFDQCGWRGYEWGGQIRMYFRFSDSMTTGAFKHAGFRDSYRIDTGFQTDLFGGIVCYREPPGYQITWGTQLWATDGTAEGTQRIARISSDPEGSKPSYFVELNQRLYFQASSTDFGSELWSTDGTRTGTYLVADIEFGSRSSEPQFLIVFDSQVFFSAETLNYGRELWFSNGESRFEFTGDQHASVGTGLLLDICAGTKSSSPQHFAVLSPLNGSPSLLFQADDCVHGPELWSTDGTRAGTTLVQDINKGSTGSHPAYLTGFAEQVYFQADDGVHGSELWVSDGTSIGTIMLFDIAPGVLGSIPSFFTILETTNAPSGILVFAAQAEQDRLTEFWSSDGTSNGTTKLFPMSREVVDLNLDSLDLQLAGHTFVSISSQPQAFFYLGQEHVGQGVDFQQEAANRLSTDHAEGIADTRSITFQDVESMQSTQELTVSLNCSKGWLSLERQCDNVTVSLDGTPDGMQAGVITLTGSLSALNCAVEKVTYHSKPLENGWDEIHVTLSQGGLAASSDGITAGIGDTERDSSYTVSKRMLVEIRAINDPPSISMVSTFYAPVGEWVTLAGIEITDPDSADGILYISIATRSGKLRVALPPGVNGGGPTALHATVGGDDLQLLEFATTIEQTTTIFGALEYSCDDDHGCANSPRDYLTVQVDDNGFTGAHGPQVAIKTAEIVVITEASV